MTRQHSYLARFESANELYSCTINWHRKITPKDKIKIETCFERDHGFKEGSCLLTGLDYLGKFKDENQKKSPLLVISMLAVAASATVHIYNLLTG